MSLSSRNLQTKRKDKARKNTSNKKYSVINAKRKTNTKKREKENLKTQGIDECFMRDYNRCWPLKVDKMSRELGVVLGWKE